MTLRPEDFGAVGNGETDDTAAVQAALDRAEGTAVSLLARTYAIRDTLLVPTNSTLYGNSATIVQKSRDKPILASRAWARKGPTKGGTRIRDLRLRGNGQGARQDGCILHDYWSEISDVEVSEVGGRGIVLTHEDISGRQPSGTLVENQIRNCVVRNARRTAFWLGAVANGKLTDGTLLNCIASLDDSAREPGLFIGHAAGWRIDGLHVYGGRPATSCEVHQGYFTSIAHLYLEGFAETGLALHRVQTHVQVSNSNIVSAFAGEDAAFVTASAHRDFDKPTVMLSNVGLSHAGGTRLLMARSDDAVWFIAHGVAVSGLGAARIVPGQLQDAMAATSGSRDPAGSSNATTFTWEGSRPLSIQIASRPDDRKFESGFLVAITARSSDGGLVTSYSGLINWQRAEGRQGVTIADIAGISPALGLRNQPELSVERREGNLVLLLRFFPIATGAGQISVIRA